MMTEADPRPGVPPAAGRLWLKIAGAGLALWTTGLLALEITQDSTLVPAVIFVGAFWIPVVCSVWLYEREQATGPGAPGQGSALSPALLVSAFLAGGILGLTIAAVFETYLLADFRLLAAPGVAVIEETLKVVLVWVIARHLRWYLRRDGMVLGAVVAFGYAAFETAGYAFTVLINEPEEPNAALDLLTSELVRGLLAPVGHAVWTALVAGALFAAAVGGRRLRITSSVVGWWLFAVAAHSVWDWAPTIAVALTEVSTGQSITLGSLTSGRLVDLTPQRMQLFEIYSWLTIALVAGIGTWLALRMWAKGRVLPTDVADR